MCPLAHVLATRRIATVPQERLGQMQRLAILQNCIDVLFSAIAST
jgi:hypothetical protein